MSDKEINDYLRKIRETYLMDDPQLNLNLDDLRLDKAHFIQMK